MIKFIEWLGGFYAGLRGCGVGIASINYIDGYVYGYQRALAIERRNNGEGVNA